MQQHRRTMAIFKQLFKSIPTTAAEGFIADPAPDRPLYVVGDIHGCADLLDEILEKIKADVRGRQHDLVFVGDYIDRGEASNKVLARLHAIAGRNHVTCLMGNHERMLLDFLDNPVRNGRRWFRNGGLQTLASFGIGSVTESSKDHTLTTARDELMKNLGGSQQWLATLPLSYQSGNIFVAHAAAHPAMPIGNQPDKILLWGHPDFFSQVRRDSTWIVHGHTVVENPCVDAGRIGVDTGAYATGRLTAAVISTNKISFLSTG